MELDRAGLLHEGKSKRVYATTDPGRVILEFKDDATAFNGKKHALVTDKAVINCAISAHLFHEVAARGVRHHMLARRSERELLCEQVQVIPVEVVVRNICAGSLATRYGREEGEVLPSPLVEWFYKSDQLNDPLMGEDIPVLFGWARRWEMAFLREQALVVNDVLTAFWGGLGVDLVDFKLEFGRAADGRVLLADEVTPDGSRLWERGTRKKLDKDVFRRDLGSLTDTYRALYERVFGHALQEQS